MLLAAPVFAPVVSATIILGEADRSFRELERVGEEMLSSGRRLIL
jgi:hypothetical protein